MSTRIGIAQIQVEAAGLLQDSLDFAADFDDMLDIELIGRFEAKLALAKPIITQAPVWRTRHHEVYALYRESS